METIRIGVEFVPSNAYARAFIEGVSSYAMGHRDWKLVAIRQKDVSRETFSACDGVIMRVLDERPVRLAKSLHIPLVDIACDRMRRGIGQVSSDEHADGRMAAEFFLSRSFTNFAYCGIGGQSYSDQCCDAYSETLRRSGFSVMTYEPPAAHRYATVVDDNRPHKISDRTALRKWLAALPRETALFCCNDYRAYQVMTVANQLGLNIPSDLAILGCDNDAMLCSFAPTPLSSIDPDAKRVGSTAARLLAAMLGNPPDDRPHAILRIPPKGLIRRASTESMPVKPAWLAEALLEIDRELANGISARRIFELAKLSPPTVEKVFRARFGCSVQKHITRLRIEKARELLSAGTLSIKEIAADLGFGSVQYFCKTFKAFLGQSPGEYAQTAAKAAHRAPPRSKRKSRHAYPD